jgi:hypothetical protein
LSLASGPLGSVPDRLLGEGMNVLIEDGNTVGYKANLAVTFILEEYFA